MPQGFSWGLTKPPVGAAVNWGHPLTAGLVGLWLLNEGAGISAQDGVQSVQGAFAASSGAVVPSWSPGDRFGPVADFTLGEITCTDSPLYSFGTGNFTVAAWIKCGIVAAEMGFVTKFNVSSNEGLSLAFLSGGGGKIRFYAPLASVFDSTTLIADSRWHLVIGTRLNGTIFVYVDGKKDATAPVASSASVNVVGPLRIGGKRFGTAGGAGYTGQIAAAYVYNRGFEASDAQRLYAEPFSMMAAPVYRRIAPVPTFSVVTGAATLSGSGALAASAKAIIKATAALSGAGALSGAASVRVKGSATLSGSGALSASGALRVQASAALSGAGALVATSLVKVQGAASSSGAGALSASALMRVQGSAALTGTGSLSTVALVVIQGAAALSGSGALSAASLALVKGSASLTGTGSLTADGSVIPGLTVVTGAASLHGSGSLAASGRLRVRGVAALSGSGSLAATASVIGVVHGAASLSGSGALAAGARIRVRGTAHLQGAGSLSASSHVLVKSSLASLHGAGSLATFSIVITFGTALLSGKGFLRVRYTSRVDLEGQELEDVILDGHLGEILRGSGRSGIAVELRSTSVETVTVRGRSDMELVLGGKRT